MKIEKYKYLGNDKYKVIIDKKEYIIYENTIIKYNLLTKENITQKELNNYLNETLFYENYYLGLKYITQKLRTKKELEKYLEKKEVSSKDIRTIIERLTEEGYLNEEVYTKAYIYDEINLKMTGPNKIKKDLITLGISKDIIDKFIEIYDKETIHEKIKKYISKEIKINKNKSSNILKRKILSNLITKGFDKEDIDLFLNEIKVNDEEIYKREYNKIYEKLSKKYSGKELEYKIKQKMYQRGFYS